MGRRVGFLRVSTGGPAWAAAGTLAAEVLTAGVLAAGMLAAGVLAGCGVSPAADAKCSLQQGVLPATATADHAAAAPANQQAFDVGFVGPFPAGCAVPTFVANPASFTWVSSDPVNAPISNAAATAGVATCAGTTTTPATISVSSSAGLTVATLSCK